MRRTIVEAKRLLCDAKETPSGPADEPHQQFAARAERLRARKDSVPKLLNATLGIAVRGDVRPTTRSS
eukprot:856258-Lingulodinium_polyedra.AAC.1